MCKENSSGYNVERSVEVGWSEVVFCILLNRKEKKVKLDCL